MAPDEIIATYTVVGMTCGHCVTSVKREVRALPGVNEVEIHLPTGRLTVYSDAELSVESVEAAVEEAGYELAEPAEIAAGGCCSTPAPDGRPNLLAGGSCGCGGSHHSH